MTQPRPAWEPPVLVRHQAGWMNKFSRVASMRPLDAIDGVPVAELVAAYGSPVFVFSERALVARHRELRDAFSTRWPKVRIAWSYKTNYLDGICRRLHREGAWAEVVSGFEYDKAVRNGVPEDHIHFNGPGKSAADLARAFRGGAIVHLDHFDELVLAERVAADLDLRPGVALRLHVTAEGVPPWSRFGFHVDGGQARDAARRLLAGDRLRLVGLHTHLGTFLQDPAPYRDAARQLAAFANTLRAEHGVVLDFLDLGGGFASHNTLKAQYLPGSQVTPGFDRYAEAIVDGLSALEGDPSRSPTLVLETGRAVVDDAGWMITTVLANKRLPDGRRALVVDAGVNTLFTSFWYNPEVTPAATFHGIPEPTVIYGPLCMNIDVVRDTLLFPPVSTGDRLVIHPVGAYDVTQWMQFITYRPAVAIVGADGRHGLLRRAERLEDVVGPEEVPAWLA